MNLKIKCIKCPYRLCEIKCIKLPCPECIKSKSKKHPFPEAEIHVKSGDIVSLLTKKM